MCAPPTGIIMGRSPTIANWCSAGGACRRERRNGVLRFPRVKPRGLRFGNHSPAPDKRFAYIGRCGGLVSDDDSSLGGRGVESRRAHSYDMEGDDVASPPLPAQSLSGAVRAEIRDVFPTGGIPEPIVQTRLGLSEFQSQRRESLCVANQVVSEMQRVLNSCHSAQSQMGDQINATNQKIELNTAHVHNIHFELHRAEQSQTDMNRH